MQSLYHMESQLSQFCKPSIKESDAGCPRHLRTLGAALNENMSIWGATPTECWYEKDQDSVSEKETGFFQDNMSDLK